MFELWAFFPDGEAIGAIGFSSNDKGDTSDPSSLKIASAFKSKTIP